MVYALHGIHPGKLEPQILWDIRIQADNQISPKQKQKKRTYRIVHFAVPADHKIKLKENQKKDKSQYLSRELKRLWNMKATEILILIGALGTVTKGLIKGLEDLEIRGRVEINETMVLLRSARIEF